MIFGEHPGFAFPPMQMTTTPFSVSISTAWCIVRHSSLTTDSGMSASSTTVFHSFFSTSKRLASFECTPPTRSRCRDESRDKVESNPEHHLLWVETVMKSTTHSYCSDTNLSFPRTPEWVSERASERMSEASSAESVANEWAVRANERANGPVLYASIL